MILKITRDVFGAEFTLGTLTVDGKSFGYVVEDQDRGLKQTDTLEHIAAVKVPDETCIPYGRYRVKTTWSNRYKKPMPLVLDTPGFRGIRIHSGNTDDDTSGCIVPGLERDAGKGTVGKSRVACEWLYAEIAKVEKNGGEVWLELVSG